MFFWKPMSDSEKLVFLTCHHAAVVLGLFCYTVCIIAVRWPSFICHFLFPLQAAHLLMFCCSDVYFWVPVSLVWSDWTHLYYHNGWQHRWTLRASYHRGVVELLFGLSYEASLLSHSFSWIIHNLFLNLRPNPSFQLSESSHITKHQMSAQSDLFFVAT